jgi:penicillin-binding protein 1A
LSNQRNNTGEKLFSFATDALRQPGSTAKPIFAYGPGFEYNNNSTYSIFVDEPWAYTDGPSINNWDGGFYGIVTTRYALQGSRNIPALKAYQQVGSKKIQQFAYSLGLDVSYSKNSEN